ncbi:alanine--glyoxylate aminotransferase family protein [Pseudomonadota bacterium]|nr:alanine--glyoxylate aminotransferase family protein [Pseudomonadota bacterium]
MKVNSFIPPNRILMGPGPSDVCDRVLQAMARPTIGHLDPMFIKMMDETKQLLQYAFQTQNELTFAVSAPGMAGMECCFANLVEPDDKVIIAKNGFFGERMKENVERFGGIPIVIDDAWGTKVDLNKIEAALNEHTDAKIVASVHAETSTGALTDPESITKLAHDHGCLSIVDTVTGLVGVPLKVDEWGIDAIYSGTQKCLSASPGLSPISFSNAAKEKIKNRKSKVKSWFLDLNLIMSYWEGEGGRSYHHTAPINSLYGFHEALVMLSEEGLENSWKRHKENHLKLREGLEKLNIEFLVKEEDRLPQLNAIYIPDGVNDLESRQRLLNEFNLEIGAGLGVLAGKVWRIGLMGQSSNKKNIEYCLNSLAEVI